MKVKTIEQLIIVYQRKEETAKAIDNLVSKLALRRRLNTYRQCLEISEYINHKQELINLCQIFEEEFDRLKTGRRKQIFKQWLDGQNIEEVSKAFNLSLRTCYCNIFEVKQVLAKQFEFDGYTDKILQEILSNVALT